MSNLFMPYGSSRYLGIVAKDGVVKSHGPGLATKIGQVKGPQSIDSVVVRLNAKRR